MVKIVFASKMAKKFGIYKRWRTKIFLQNYPNKGNFDVAPLSILDRYWIESIAFATWNLSDVLVVFRNLPKLRAVKFTLLLNKQALKSNFWTGILQLTWNQGSLFSRNDNTMSDRTGFQEPICDRKILMFANSGTSSWTKINLCFLSPKCFL